MIIILKKDANKQKVESLKTELVNQGFKLHLSEGTEASLIGLIGDTSMIHEDWLRANDVVEDVRRIREPYKKANRSMHPDDTVIDVCGRKIGGGSFAVSDAYNSYPLAVKLHIADLTATYLMEQGTSAVENGHPKNK